MPRPSKPSELTLEMNREQLNGIPNGPKTSPMRLETVELSPFGERFEHEVANELRSISPLHGIPPPEPPKSKNTASSQKLAPKVSSRALAEEEATTLRQGQDAEDEFPPPSGMSKIYHLRKNPGSSPELSLVSSADSMQKVEGANGPPEAGLRSRPSPLKSTDSLPSRRKDKTFRLALSHGKSIRRDSNSSNSKPRVGTVDSFEPPPKMPQTDPASSDMSQLYATFREKRGKSTERTATSESEENQPPSTLNFRSGLKAGGKTMMTKARSGGGSLLNRLGKIGRSGTHGVDKEIPDSEYQVKIIHLPLIEQTRITRISKQLTGCRDKTEYWMASLPYRAIDYLNSKCEVEGLYRIPGSGPHVKHWQRRFDTEIDVDLLSQEVLDPNEIASLLKSWLREQPSEIMPANAQKLLAIELEKENPQFRNMGQPASQLLRDALSDLAPFNYYLLFAITCHLSLLLANKDRNRMDLNNLALCVGPCLNLDRWLFNYLVGDWRHCWQGCYTEKEAIEIENKLEPGDFQPPSSSHDVNALKLNFSRAGGADDGRSDDVAVVDDHATTSSGSSNPGSSHGDSKGGHNQTIRSHNRDQYKLKAHTAIGAKIYGNESADSTNGQGEKAPADKPRGERGQILKEPTDSGVRKNSASTLPSFSRGGDAPPTHRHVRTRSDAPSTPIKTSMDGDFKLPIQHPSP